MVLCPVIGPLFFFMGQLFYLLVFWRDVDLADVIFSKERVRTRMKADEERERDIIPLEEAILVNEKKDLRMVMMNVIKEDIRNSLASITLALDSEDSEASHYAAAVLSDELNKFRLYVHRKTMPPKKILPGRHRSRRRSPGRRSARRFSWTIWTISCGSASSPTMSSGNS